MRMIATPDTKVQGVQEEYQYIINPASFLPLVVLKDGVWDVLSVVEDMGYTGASWLPLRNYHVGHERFRESLPITHIESAWNPTDAKTVMGQLFEVAYMAALRNLTAPQLRDVVAFPDSLTCENELNTALDTLKKAFYIGHTYKGAYYYSDRRETSGIVEINPGMGMSLEELLETIESTDISKKLVKGVDFDTTHTRRKKRRDEIARDGCDLSALPDNMPETLDMVFAYIELVDFQAESPEELHKTINHKGLTWLNDLMVEIVRNRGYKGPIRVEFFLGLKTHLDPNNLYAVSKDILAYLADLRGDYSKSKASFASV